MKNINKIISMFCGTIAIIFVMVHVRADNSDSGTNPDLNSESVIATYKNYKILYKDIMVKNRSGDNVTGKFELSDDDVMLLEKQRFLQKVRDLAFKDGLKKFQIEVSEDEVNTRRDELIRRSYEVDEFTQEMAEKHNRLVDEMLLLIDLYAESPVKAEEKYIADFADSLPQDDWNYIKGIFASPDGIQQLKSQYTRVDPETINERFRKIALNQIQIEKLVVKENLNDGLPAATSYSEWLNRQLELTEMSDEFKNIFYSKSK